MKKPDAAMMSIDLDVQCIFFLFVLKIKKIFFYLFCFYLAMQLAFDRETLILLIDVVDQIASTHKRLSSTFEKVTPATITNIVVIPHQSYLTDQRRRYTSTISVGQQYLSEPRCSTFAAAVTVVAGLVAASRAHVGHDSCL